LGIRHTPGRCRGQRTMLPPHKEARRARYAPLIIRWHRDGRACYRRPDRADSWRFLKLCCNDSTGRSLGGFGCRTLLVVGLSLVALWVPQVLSQTTENTVIPSLELSPEWVACQEDPSSCTQLCAPGGPPRVSCPRLCVCVCVCVCVSLRAVRCCGGMPSPTHALGRPC
jgi:hypothetical protein